MKARVLILFLCMWMPFLCQAQKYLSVDTLYYDASDLEANANVKYDAENNPYALVKISLPLPDVVVEQDATIGYIDQRRNAGEIWVYITAAEDYGATKLTLKFEQYHEMVVNFADWGIEPKGMCVYKMKVSVPSTLFEEAIKNYDNLEFAKADSIFRLIPADETTTKAEKKLAVNYSRNISDYIAYNNKAAGYAAKYILFRKKGIGKKKELVCVLDSAIYWYNILYTATFLSKVKDIREKLIEVKEKIVGTRIIEGTLRRRKKINNGAVVNYKQEKLCNVFVFVRKKGETVIKTFDTDNKGHFILELSDAYECELVFKYKGFESDIFKLKNQDKNLNIILNENE